METGDQVRELHIEACEWSHAAGEILKAAMVHATVEDLQRQAENGASLFKVTDKGELVGFYLLRVDQTASGNEGVLVAGAGKHADIDLTFAVIPLVERQFIGCKNIRIHTARPGLIKKLGALGYKPLEFVMGRDL